MTVYDAKNIEFSWKGITLTGTGDDHAYSISQEGASVKPYKGVQGEGLNIVNNQRIWKISRSFKVDSKSLPMLFEDCMNFVEDELVVRDINTGKDDIFSECMISSIEGEKDSSTRVVHWVALSRNSK